MYELQELITFYYVTSIGLTFYQNWLLKKVKFPLSIVMSHFILKLLLSWLSRLSYSLYTGLARVSLGKLSVISALHPTVHFEADPDTTFQIIRIHADPDPQHCYLPTY